MLEVELAGAGRELEDVVRIVDADERRARLLALHEARDVLVEDRAAEARRDHVDELLSVQQSCEVGVVEDARRARQAERRTGHHHGLAGRHAIAGVETARLLEEGGEHATELEVSRVVADDDRRPARRGRERRGRQRHDGRWRRRRGRGWCLLPRAARGASRDGFFLSDPHPGRVQPAQRLIEGDDVVGLRMIGEQ